MKKIIPTIVALVAALFCYVAQPAKADNLFIESMINKQDQDTIMKLDVGKHKVSAEYDSNGEVNRFGTDLALGKTKVKTRTDDTNKAYRVDLDTKLNENFRLEMCFGENEDDNMNSLALHYKKDNLKLGIGQTDDLAEKAMIAYAGGKAGDLGFLASINHKDEKTIVFGVPKEWRLFGIYNPNGYNFSQLILADNITGIGGYLFLAEDYADADGENTLGMKDTTRYTGCDINFRGSKALVVFRLDLPNGTKIEHFEAAYNPDNKGNWIGFAYERMNDSVEKFIPELGVNLDIASGKLQINYAIICDEDWQKQAIKVRAQLTQRF